jgi:hypothetical protein
LIGPFIRFGAAPKYAAAEPKTISFGSEEVPNDGVSTVAAKGLVEYP